ncbi:MAG: undecaprenyl-diphosphate phosphatase [Treponema sp.]|jgi:undecaprenyl-diphosphatase|nr:undecaprenyl-diphosphate phosphatase [Treponema sp.]
MSIIEALILGAVQGITEFLPVSSSGHLVLLQKIFKIEEPSLFFDTMVHAGTLAAVFVVLWRDIWNILRRIIQPITLYLIIGTLPAVFVALVFKDHIENAFASGSFLGFAFLITSVLLIASEFICRRSGNRRGLPGKIEGDGAPRGQDEMTRLDALVIGVLQAIAILPGVSRSGATLSGALSRRLDRDFAARFSFLLSIPAILGAVALQVKDLAGGTKGGIGQSMSSGAAVIIAGTLAAALVGFFSVRLMLKIVRERSLAGFAVYTALLGVLVLADQYKTHFFF